MRSLSAVQFETAQQGRRLGVVSGGEVIDVTAVDSQLLRVTDAYRLAVSQGVTLANCLTSLAGRSTTRLAYAGLLGGVALLSCHCFATVLSRQAVLGDPLPAPLVHRVRQTSGGTSIGSLPACPFERMRIP